MRQSRTENSVSKKSKILEIFYNTFVNIGVK